MEDEDPPSSAYLPSTQVHYASEVLIHTYKRREAPEHIYSAERQEKYMKDEEEDKRYDRRTQVYMYFSSLHPFFIENKIREVERRLLSYTSSITFSRKKKRNSKKKIKKK